MIVHKAYRYRIYPNEAQQETLTRYFGCARFVYNYYRAKREESYKESGKGWSYAQCNKDLTTLRRQPETIWLKEAPSQSLQWALMDLDAGYKNFFAKRAKYPRFRSKHDKQVIRFYQNFGIREGKFLVPKLGLIKMAKDRPLEGTPKQAALSKTKTGKYYVSIMCEVEIEPPLEVPPIAVGIDLGIKTFATLYTSEGDAFTVDNPRHLKTYMRRLKIRQRRLSRKTKGSNSRKKAKQVVAATHEKVTGQRQNFLHQVSRYIVNNYGAICVEDLNIKGMVQNHNLAGAISDASWSEFVRQLEYKAKWGGCTVVKVDRWLPSSKTCSECGHKMEDMNLKIREWDCPSCGVRHDRDQNAAANILKEGLRLIGQQ